MGAKLSALFTWIVGTEFARLRRSDFFHFYKLEAKHQTRRDPGYPAHMWDHWQPIKSYVLCVSFLRGKGYCHWLFGRRFSLRGFTVEFGWRVFRYKALHLKERRTIAFGVYCGGNAGWMPLWP